MLARGLPMLALVVALIVVALLYVRVSTSADTPIQPIDLEASPDGDPRAVPLESSRDFLPLSPWPGGRMVSYVDH
jgi:hypothetical protein